MSFDVANKNGRIYSYDSVDINDPILTEMLEQKALFGELSFPKDGRTETDMHNVSHAITALRKEADGLYADIDILNTMSGRILNEYVNKNNFRTRGIGDAIADENGNYMIDNYTLLTIDYTNDPA